MTRNMVIKSIMRMCTSWCIIQIINKISNNNKNHVTQKDVLKSEIKMRRWP